MHYDVQVPHYVCIFAVTEWHFLPMDDEFDIQYLC